MTPSLLTLVTDKMIATAPDATLWQCFQIAYNENETWLIDKISEEFSRRFGE